MKLVLALVPLLAGCAVEVYHPTRTMAEQKRDIEICKEHADLTEPMEPVAMLNVAYDCLEKKGYMRRKPKPIVG